jgi:hypothetical protein
MGKIESKITPTIYKKKKTKNYPNKWLLMTFISKEVCTFVGLTINMINTSFPGRKVEERNDSGDSILLNKCITSFGSPISSVVRVRQFIIIMLYVVTTWVDLT